jgi:hypothetical protein
MFPQVGAKSVGIPRGFVSEADRIPDRVYSRNWCAETRRVAPMETIGRLRTPRVTMA